MDSTTALAVKSAASTDEDAQVVRAAPVLSWADAQLAGWAVLACLSLVLNGMRPELFGGGLKTQLLQSLYPAGQLLAAGVVTGVLTWAFRARGTRSVVWTLTALSGASFTLGWTVLKDDLAQIQNRLAHHAPPLFWRASLTLFVALLVPAALLVGRAFAHPRLRARVPLSRVLGVVLGLTCHVIGRNYVLPQAFPGLHLMLAIAAAMMIGAALEGAALPSFGRRATAGDRLGATSDPPPDPAPGLSWASSLAPHPPEARPSLLRTIAWILATIWGACAILIAPPVQVSFQMMQPPAASMAPFIAQLHARPIAPLRTPDEVAALFQATSPPPPKPPSRAALLPPDGAVVLVTIDCLRADLLRGDRHEAALPNLVALRRASADFTAARSPANFTIVALSSMFTGRYESQLAWSERPTPHSRYRTPVLDPSPRVAELLADTGVRTVTVSGAEWLDGGSGIVRGFREEVLLGPAEGQARGEDMVDAAIDRVERHASGPLFLYLHLFDAHDPYDRGGVEGTQFERYVRELTLVDRELGRLTRAVDAKFPGRAAVIVTADHGEAFGEHQTTRHGGTVYDEVVHVPLLVRAPGVTPRAIPDAVSTIDLGPTILDLFRVSTPFTFMSRSLVPLLAGETLPQEPVAIESRGYVALVHGGFKILRRKRYDTIELYDLAADPGEKVNLFREDDPVSAQHMSAMDKFFDDVARK